MDAEQRIRCVARSLTTSFPIGWQRFPSCAAADPPDLRCTRQPLGFAEGSAPAWYRLLSSVMGWLPESIRRTAEPIGRRTQTLAAVSVASPAQFYQWVVGVLLTTVLLGLGSPFWVKVASSALSLSRTARGESPAAGQPAQPAGASRGQSGTRP